MTTKMAMVMGSETGKVPWEPSVPEMEILQDSGTEMAMASEAAYVAADSERPEQPVQLFRLSDWRHSPLAIRSDWRTKRLGLVLRTLLL